MLSAPPASSTRPALGQSTSDVRRADRQRERPETVGGVLGRSRPDRRDSQPVAVPGHIHPVGFQSPRRFSCAAKLLTRLAQSAMQIFGAESFAGAVITLLDVIDI